MSGSSMRCGPRRTRATFSVKQALRLGRTLKPKRTILTHMTSELDYDTLRRHLPAGIEPAFDGMQVEFG